ncbi:MAG: hypothetical protein CVT67_09070 [Actinobacteria bacterium HGW-Actinobacteria-7]|nr:MAG: hypothetical protein CVT67_09070 [Actinobacteria bacterium HGW-Actinobacteria-7]
MGSKARVKFLNRAARYDGDIEFVDVIYTAVIADHMTPEDGVPLFAGVDVGRHPRLAGQKPTSDNRRHVAGHLRRSVYASYIKDLYEDFAEYLMEIVSVARKGSKPTDIAREHKVTLEAGEILDCHSLEDVLGLVTASFFDRLEQMSNTKRILQLLNDGLGLDLDAVVVAAAQPYVELRHLLVHTDGVASPEFCAEFPDF